MHVVLLVLKMVGILLACILGILLILLLTVLLVPVRYRLRADNLEEARASAAAGWLLRILYFKGSYEKEVFIYRVKLFGITIKSNLPKKEKKHKKKAPKKPRKGDGTENTMPAGAALPKKAPAEAVTETTAAEKTAPAQSRSMEAEPEDTAPGKAAAVNDPSERQEEEPGRSKEERGGWKKSREAFLKWKQRILALGSTIRTIWNTIKKQLKDGFSNIKDTAEKAKKIIGFLTSEENKPGFSAAYACVKGIGKHIRPSRAEGRLEFGTGDPYSTGQALGIMSIFYGFYGASIEVIPNFQEEIIKAEFFCKGRIRIGTLLILILRLIVSKEFKTAVLHFKQLKQEI